MYRTRTSRKEKAIAFATALILPAGMIMAFLRLGNIDALPPQVRDNPLITILADPPPPPPIAEEPVKATPNEEGKSAPPAKKAKAKEVVAPKPKVVVPTPQPMEAAPVKNDGNEAASGGVDKGEGTGAGGVGDGTGSGGSGTGMGGGGSGVKLVKGITNRDYPKAVQRKWPAGGQIFTRLRIRPDGSVKSCDVMRSYGDRTADMLTCSLLTKKGRFRPATDASGRPIEAWFGYVQRDLGRFDR